MLRENLIARLQTSRLPCCFRHRHYPQPWFTLGQTSRCSGDCKGSMHVLACPGRVPQYSAALLLTARKQPNTVAAIQRHFQAFLAEPAAKRYALPAMPREQRKLAHEVLYSKPRCIHMSCTAFPSDDLCCSFACCPTPPTSVCTTTLQLQTDNCLFHDNG